MQLSEKDNKAITNWLFVVCGLIMFMVVLGGYVRLTRSGLSIVEWNPISGVVPPIGDAAWEAEFAKYQQTPEFQKINTTMTLEGYKRIFYVEYVHRLLARFAGLIVLIPLIYFLVKGIIPWRKSAVYVAIVGLFAFQGFLGWYMVSSGLIDNPHVDHFRLTIHLLMALFLLALALWVALNHYYRFPPRVPDVFWSSPFILSALTIAVLVIQISYGGFVAGLKAGWISNTWPLMYGRLIPPGMLSQIQPWWLNLLEAPLTVHFIHRWFALAVLVMAGVIYWQTRSRPFAATIHKAIRLFGGLVLLQIALGVSVVWFSVPLWLALAHQAVAMFLFVTAVFINYGVLHEPVGERVASGRLQVAGD
ncbi:MAG TPA: COX15/CtaA family protein [Chloroflexota bacterium]|nr:COX15/CtaA family protein [Chloroflexota bacterium]HUM68984.1 COX15/CtaA family protein [Chloroflexota bacterium]